MRRKKPNLKLARPGQEPGYWVNKTSFEKISRECPKPDEPQLVYLALNRVMNERKSRRFCTATICEIGRYSGLHPAKVVEAAYAELERIGLITREVVTHPGGMPATFITVTGEVKYEP
jgi:hypothetical protein